MKLGVVFRVIKHEGCAGRANVAIHEHIGCCPLQICGNIIHRNSGIPSAPRLTDVVIQQMVAAQGCMVSVWPGRFLHTRSKAFVAVMKVALTDLVS